MIEKRKSKIRGVREKIVIVLLTIAVFQLQIGNYFELDAVQIQSAASAEINIGTQCEAEDTTVMYFGGLAWYVIGYNGEGVAQTNETAALTLLQKDYVSGVNQSVQYDNRDSGSNGKAYYNGSVLQAEMTRLYHLLPDEEKAYIKPYTFTHTLECLENPPFPWEPGSGTAIVDQHFWPLSSTDQLPVKQSVLSYPSSWWLRSVPGIQTAVNHTPHNMKADGTLNTLFIDMKSEISARPATKIDLSDLLFLSAADENGKSAVPVGLPLTTAKLGRNLKMTMISENIAADFMKTDEKDNAVSFSYDNATTGDNMFISCVLEQEGAVKYYGKLAKTDATGSGTVEISLTGLVNGSYTLKLFNEKIVSNTHTDYASEAYSTNVTVVNGLEPPVIPEIDDATLKDVGGYDINPEDGNGTVASPYYAEIAVPNGVQNLSTTDFHTTNPAANAATFSDSDFINPQATVTLTAGQRTVSYVEVTAEDTVTKNYYKVSILRMGLEAVPSAKIDFMEEVLYDFVPGATYIINGETRISDGNGKIDIDSDWFGNANLPVIKKGDGETTSDSDIQYMNIPSRPPRPDVAVQAESVQGREDGKISGLDNTLEYRVEGGDWNPVLTSELVDLTPGNYHFRYLATTSTFAGRIKTVTVAEGVPQSRTVTVSDIDFGTCVWGDEPPAPQIVTLTNTGNTMAEISRVVLSDEEHFILTSGESSVPGDDGQNTTWKITPKQNLPVGSYTADVVFTYDGTQETEVTAKIYYIVQPKDISSATVTITGATIYTGTRLTPAFTVSDPDALLTADDYTSSFGPNTTVAAGGSITLTGQGNYTGNKTVYFEILKAEQNSISIVQADRILDLSIEADRTGVTLTSAGGSGDGAVTWSTDNPEIAEIDNNGKLTLKAAGTVIVTVTKAADGNHTEAVSDRVTLTVVDKAALRNLIDTATGLKNTAVAGDRNGDYPQAAVNTLADAIVDAETLRDNADVLQADLDDALSTLQSAIDAFNASQIKVDYTALHTLIETAKTTKADAVQGNGNGQYTAAAMTALQDAIDAAGKTAGDAYLSQQTVDDAYEALKTALSVFKANIVSVDKNALDKMIKDAEMILEDAEIGVEPGQYPQNVADKLKDEMNQAKAILNDPNAAQEDVDRAAAELAAAMEAFANKKIPANPHTGDDRNLWVPAMLLSAGGIVIAGTAGKRRRKEWMQKQRTK